MAKKPKKRKWRGVVSAMGMGEFRAAKAPPGDYG